MECERSGVYSTVNITVFFRFSDRPYFLSLSMADDQAISELSPPRQPPETQQPKPPASEKRVESLMALLQRSIESNKKQQPQMFPGAKRRVMSMFNSPLPSASSKEGGEEGGNNSKVSIADSEADLSVVPPKTSSSFVLGYEHLCYLSLSFSLSSSLMC